MRTVIAVPFAMSIAFPVDAGTIGPDGTTVEALLFDYNALTRNNLNTQQEIEGRVYVGGDLTGANLQVGFKPVPAGGPDEILVVEGNATVGSIKGSGTFAVRGDVSSNVEEQGGSFVGLVGGSHTGLDNFNAVTDGLAGTAGFDARFPGFDFGDIASYATYLSTLTGSAVTFADPNQKAVNFLANAVASEGTNWNAGAVSVLSLDISQLSSGTFSSNVASGETIIVNVSGTSGTFGMNPTGDKAVSTRILWNFHEATDITVNTAIFGSVLAPNATMNGFNGSTEGSVIADTINQTNGELHLQPFLGDLPEPPVPPPPPVVPLPATLPLLLAALGGVAAIGRVRRSGARKL